ncbi:hypothetical protein FIBSPDRAFT_458592 [Athelia psychrophila]|uniref:Uncharacterized protein n=1 Tax=Athelia psychrophila TaxID=1759441 RepID=A0A167U9R1_9AGAM|nr:hypothetical protein FIBSPDRAFT_458592 [Fibularhizoctonia sp. CBS 109695]
MVHLMSLLKLITALCVATLSGATYVIDDTNTTIQYLPGGQQAAAAGVQWHIAQAPEVNITASYDQTSTVGECVTAQNCTMTIPFQGSGIEIFVVQVNYAALNVSIVVDTLLPSYHYYAEPQYYLHNFSLFQIEELPTGFHTVTIKLLDSQYASGDRYAYVNGTSALVFDYATVNEINIASGSTPSTAVAQPSATVSAVPTSTASSNRCHRRRYSRRYRPPHGRHPPLPLSPPHRCIPRPPPSPHRDRPRTETPHPRRPAVLAPVRRAIQCVLQPPEPVQLEQPRVLQQQPGTIPAVGEPRPIPAVGKLWRRRHVRDGVPAEAQQQGPEVRVGDQRAHCRDGAGVCALQRARVVRSWAL